MVSSSDSFFLVAELAKSTLIILALVRFPEKNPKRLMT
jgi:hypothetical protein